MYPDISLAIVGSGENVKDMKEYLHRMRSTEGGPVTANENRLDTGRMC